MARVRYCGDVKVKFPGLALDRGVVIVPATTKWKVRRWRFKELHTPTGRVVTVSDVTRAAEAAVDFGSNYGVGNRGDDLPKWAPSARLADDILGAAWDRKEPSGEVKCRVKPMKGSYWG